MKNILSALILAVGLYCNATATPPAIVVDETGAINGNGSGLLNVNAAGTIDEIRLTCVGGPCYADATIPERVMQFWSGDTALSITSGTISVSVYIDAPAITVSSSIVINGGVLQFPDGTQMKSAAISGSGVGSAGISYVQTDGALSDGSTFYAFALSKAVTITRVEMYLVDAAPGNATLSCGTNGGTQMQLPIGFGSTGFGTATVSEYINADAVVYCKFFVPAGFAPRGSVTLVYE